MKPVTAAALFAAVLAVSADANAQTPEQFYKGKQIELAIGYPPAGSNDVYARLLARHLGKHIPGNPTVVPQNRPGAGSFLNLGYVYNVAPKDGTVIGIGAPTAPLDEKLGTQGVRFKSSELNWIGRIDSLINMVFLWHTSPVKTFDDALKIESKLSGTGVGSTVSVYPTVTNNVLGTKFKLIMGYKGSNDAQLAVERGEVEGRCTTLNSLRTAQPHWLTDKLVRVLVVVSRVDDPEFASVPRAKDLLKTDAERKAFDFFQAPDEIQNPYMLPPGTPADVLATYRKAFDAAVTDPAYLADAEKRKQNVVPRTGDFVQKTIAEMYATSPEVIERVKKATSVAGRVGEKK